MLPAMRAMCDHRSGARVGEFAVIALAAFRAGAVVNPLMPIFREHEFGYMLGFAKTKLLIVPKLFRGFDHETMAPHRQANTETLSVFEESPLAQGGHWGVEVGSE
jgi:non-ribosomal peptide synthetase component E (peptide arylation enzyme)